MRRESVGKLIKAAFLLVLLAPLAVKAVHIDLNMHANTGAYFDGAGQVVANDAILYLLMIALLYVSFLPGVYRIVAVLMRVLTFVIYLFYTMDAIVIFNFSTHLTLNDLIEYAWYTPFYVLQITRKRDILMIAALVPAVGLLGWATFTRYTLTHKAQHIAVIIGLACLLTATFFVQNQRYTHSWKFKNVVAYSLEVYSASRPYSEAFIARPITAPEPTVVPHTPRTPNIIILAMESLSSYQSDYFSGIFDWTPNLDRIARENQAYPGFFSNGFCTNDSYICLFTGRLPLRPTTTSGLKWGGSFEGFENPTGTLPQHLKARGYTTEFLMSADLGFGNVGEWAKIVGFDHIEGHTHPYYDNWDKTHFGSAPDEALYQRLRERIGMHGDRRYFMYVSTISSHHPYVNPETGNKSESETIMYADKHLGIFYDWLVETGFFDNGVLIIFGDHLAMVPMRAEAMERFGQDRAAARIPLVVADGSFAATPDNGVYQHTDVFNSLINLTSDTRRTTDFHGDIFDHIPAKYAVFRRGDYRNLISVFSDDGDYLVKLDGDNSRIIDSDPVDAATGQQILGMINSVRMPKTVASPNQPRRVVQSDANPAPPPARSQGR